jgi:hypothetical protein
MHFPGSVKHGADGAAVCAHQPDESNGRNVYMCHAESSAAAAAQRYCSKSEHLPEALYRFRCS